ncbi:Stk1 family PASTA domain-containing Ser/Thr kinase [Corynebacterium anserum]
MSDVYAATDELLGRDVAVKIMRADLARDVSFLERFRREAQNSAKLNHPNIVAVYDTGETPESDGSVPYIIMERVHGDTLRDIINEHGKLGLNDAAKVMSEVANALHFSHEAGIIHRDIKPANIMITNTGSVKVMDFGIARALSDSSAAMTQTAAVIGTAQYLSPEQARGKSADARSDIYAAGCVFYELATGRPPFEGESPFSVAFQHVQDDPVPPSSVPGMHLSKREALSIDSIILASMAKKPGNRYHDASQMATDLRRLSEDQLPLVAQEYLNHSESTSTSVMPAAGAGGLAGAAAGYGAAHAAEAEGATGRDEAQYSSSADGYPGAGNTYDSYGDNYGSDYADYNTAENYGEHNGDDSDEDYYEDDQKRSRVAPVLWTLVILAALGAGGFAVYNYVLKDPHGSESTNADVNVTIPNVKNLSRADAEKALSKAGLQYDVTEHTHAQIPRDTAIGTEPEPGSTVPKGTRIKLVISSGKEITEVPDLTGLTTDAARQALEKAGLELNPQVREEASSDTPAGQILSQSPDQGSQVSKGTRVTITVSSGPELVRVPVVVGQDVDNARSNLESAGFQVQVNEVDSTEAKGKVLGQTGQGKDLEKGSVVTLQVSKGNQFVMPSLQGKKYDDIVRLLRSAGWEGDTSDIQRRDIRTTDITRQEEVAQQSVRAGDKADKHSSFTIDVYTFSLLPDPLL